MTTEFAPSSTHRSLSTGGVRQLALIQLALATLVNSPSRVHRARGCDGRGINAKQRETKTASEQAFRAFPQVSEPDHIGLIPRRSQVQILPPLRIESPRS